jgi:hypothetical protein
VEERKRIFAIGRSFACGTAIATVGDKVQTRRLECSNPASGTAQLQEELSELLLAHERAKAARGRKK